MAPRADSLLSWRVPLMQAPIGPAATPALAAAVSEAGGIGSLGASWTEAEELRSQIREIRRATDRPFGVNLVLAFEQEERLEIALAEGVELILFSWGVRADLVARVHAAGRLVVAQAGSVEEAHASATAGCDIVLVQGVEAGGHVQGEAPVLALVGELARTLAVPVIAAGGIADVRGARPPSPPARSALRWARGSSPRPRPTFTPTGPSGCSERRRRTRS